MAHDIGEMFYVGEKPWHGLGNKLARAATAIEALKEGGLDWTVEPVPLVTDETPPSPARTRVALVRSDRAPGDPRRVIGVVHRDFKPLQNRDGVMMFDRLLGRGERV